MKVLYNAYVHSKHGTQSKWVSQLYSHLTKWQGDSQIIRTIANRSFVKKFLMVFQYTKRYWCTMKTEHPAWMLTDILRLLRRWFINTFSYRIYSKCLHPACPLIKEGNHILPFLAIQYKNIIWGSPHTPQTLTAPEFSLNRPLPHTCVILEITSLLSPCSCLLKGIRHCYTSWWSQLPVWVQLGYNVYCRLDFCIHLVILFHGLHLGAISLTNHWSISSSKDGKSLTCLIFIGLEHFYGSDVVKIFINIDGECYPEQQKLLCKTFPRFRAKNACQGRKLFFQQGVAT